MARRLAKLVPFYEYDEQQFFRSDGAPDDVAERRRAGFMRLAELYRERFAETREADRGDRSRRSPICSSPRPTACRSSTAASCAQHLQRRLVLSVVVGRHGHRSRRQRASTT